MQIEDAHKRKRRGKRLALGLVFAVLVMFGFAFAQVPLFRMVCQKLGFAISPLSRVKEGGNGHQVEVYFTGVVSGNLPVYFRPKYSLQTVKVGERFNNEYHFVNMSDDSVYFRPVHSVLPDEAAKKFTMMKCFCFDDQALAPHEEKTFPVISVLSNDLDSTVQQVTINYTLFEKGKDQMETGRGIPNVAQATEK
jgi:cytochrome c oxidase assembly protein subunit 11